MALTKNTGRSPGVKAPSINFESDDDLKGTGSEGTVYGPAYRSNSYQEELNGRKPKREIIPAPTLEDYAARSELTPEPINHYYDFGSNDAQRIIPTPSLSDYAARSELTPEPINPYYEDYLREYNPGVLGLSANGQRSNAENAADARATGALTPEEEAAANQGYSDVNMDDFYTTYQSLFPERDLYNFMSNGSYDDWKNLVRLPEMSQYYMPFYEGLDTDEGFDAWWNASKLQNLETVMNSGDQAAIDRLFGNDAQAWDSIVRALGSQGYGYGDSSGLSSEQQLSSMRAGLLGQYLKGGQGGLSLDEANYLLADTPFAYGTGDNYNEAISGDTSPEYINSITPFTFDQDAYNQWGMPYWGIDSLISNAYGPGVRYRNAGGA